MRGLCLRFYFCDGPNEPGSPRHEWLLQHARSIGMPGGSAFRAIAGFGRHGGLHEPRFGELPGSQPVLVEFVLPEEDARRLIDSLVGLVGGRS